MAFTIEQYNSLNDAIATGTLTVTYADKTVTYRSLNDMIRIKTLMEAVLFPSNKDVRRKYADYSKGIHPTYPDWTDEHLR